MSVEFFEFEIVLIATCLFVVEGVLAHVGFLDFLRSVGERICGVDGRRDRNCHFGSQHRTVRTFYSFRYNLKHF